MNISVFTTMLVPYITATNSSFFDFLGDPNTYEGIAYTAQFLITFTIWIAINFI